MALTEEAREVIRQATIEAITRRLGPDEIFLEIVRLVEEVETEEQGIALGELFGRIAALSQSLLASVPDEPEPVS
jgi:hypothetical protein